MSIKMCEEIPDCETCLQGLPNTQCQFVLFFITKVCTTFPRLIEGRATILLPGMTSSCRLIPQDSSSSWSLINGTASIIIIFTALAVLYGSFALFSFFRRNQQTVQQGGQFLRNLGTRGFQWAQREAERDIRQPQHPRTNRSLTVPPNFTTSVGSRNIRASSASPIIPHPPRTSYRPPTPFRRIQAEEEEEVSDFEQSLSIRTYQSNTPSPSYSSSSWFPSHFSSPNESPVTNPPATNTRSRFRDN